MGISEEQKKYFAYTEIMNQSKPWNAILQEIAKKSQAIQGIIDTHSPTRIIFTGCGSPHYLARSAAPMCREITGQRTDVYPASDIWLFPQTVLQPDEPTLLVPVSRSGETTEIMQAIDTFHRRVDTSAVIAIACYQDSSLVREVPLSLVAREAHEKSLAQTRSFTSMLVGTLALSYVFEQGEIPEALQQLPQLVEPLLYEHKAMAIEIGENVNFQRFFFLGSGPYYGLACEAMLKMKEMSLSISEAYQFLEFRHGPMSMVDDQSLIVGFVSAQALEHEVAVLREMRAKGARVWAITPQAVDPEAADYQVVLPEGVSDINRAPLYLPVVQLMVYYRTVKKGLDPDLPANLTAVIQLGTDHHQKL